MARNLYDAARFRVERQGHEPSEITVSGRERWALEALIAAGPQGCVPIETPGPRWSAYVHDLRKLGVPIKTHRERHGGPFPGNHARYSLAAYVTRLTEVTS